jgi:hypothetical protein
MTTRGPRRRAPPTEQERRSNRELREVLDELVSYVRHLATNVPNMSASELGYAQERLEWLADEVWRSVLESTNQSS